LLLFHNGGEPIKDKKASVEKHVNYLELVWINLFLQELKSFS
jgi:hypothetical protein